MCSISKSDVSNVHVLLKVSAPVSVPVWSGTQPLAKRNTPFRCRRRTWSFAGFGCGFSGQKSWSWEQENIGNQSINQIHVRTPSQLQARSWLLVFNDEKWGKYHSRLCLKWWYLNFYTIPPNTFNCFFIQINLCADGVEEIKSFLLLHVGQVMLPPDQPRNEEDKDVKVLIWTKMFMKPTSIFRRSHRKALQTVVRQSSLHWQPWSCGDDHNGFGFLWDWVQVIGGSFCSTMGTVCYSASISIQVTLLQPICKFSSFFSKSYSCIAKMNILRRTSPPRCLTLALGNSAQKASFVGKCWEDAIFYGVCQQLALTECWKNMGVVSVSTNTLDFCEMETFGSAHGSM